ncbi:MAG TPA: DMT family transporter [Nitrospiraceae bacterium]|nr:DMT family transporter [Nitrospiraceae bacterium]
MPQLALLLTTLVWGATFPATKAVLDQIPPLSFLFLRFLVGAVLALAVILVLKIPLRTDRLTLRMSLVATVWLFFGYVLQTDGLRYTTASNSAFITALYVVFVPLFLKRFQPRIWMSAGLALLGLWFLVDPSVSLNIGDLMSLACAAAFGAHIVCLESYTRQGDAVSLFAWQMVLVTGVMFIAMIVESPAMAAFMPTRMLLIGLSVTGVCATGAFAVQMWAQKIVPAQRVALIFSLEPAYAAWLSWYFLGEHLDPRGWVGSVLILAAVLLGSIGKSQAEVGAPIRPSPAV